MGKWIGLIAGLLIVTAVGLAVVIGVDIGQGWR